MAALLFVLTNLSAAWASLLLTRAFFRDETSGARVLIAVAIFPVLVLLTLILLGLAQQLSSGMALVVCTGVGLVTYLSGARASFALPDRDLRMQKEGWHDVPWSLNAALSIALIVFASGPMFARALLAGPHFSVDDLKYHAPYVTWWMQYGGFTSGHSCYYHAYYPFNAELFALWFVLPFGQDAYATLAGAFWGILLGTSLVILLLALGRSLAQALLLPALVVTMAIVPASLLRYAAVDLAGVAAIVAAMTLAVTCTPRPRLWILTGLIAGFALGSKLIFLPAVGLLALWIVLSPEGGRSLLARLKRAAFHLAGLVMTGGFWYLRNLWLTGNPLFPAQVGPFSGPIPATHFSRSSLAGWIADYAPDGAAIQALIWSHLDWPWPHFILAATGVGFALAFSLMRRGTRLELRVSGLILVMIAVSLLSYVVLPASAPDELANKAAEAKTRFLILPATLGLLAFAVAATRSVRSWPAYFAAMLICVLAAWQDSFLLALALALALGGLLLARSWLERLRAVLQFRRYATAYATLILFGLALWHPAAQRATDARLFRSSKDAGPAWKMLDSLPPGTRIVSIGASSLAIYPLFGRALSLHPLVGDWRGDVRKPLHELWKEHPGRIEWQDGGPAQDLEGFLPNMRKAAVDYIYVSRTALGEWPSHLDQLSRLGDSGLVYRDEKAQIWKLPR